MPSGQQFESDSGRDNLARYQFREAVPLSSERLDDKPNFIDSLLSSRMHLNPDSEQQSQLKEER